MVLTRVLLGASAYLSDLLARYSIIEHRYNHNTGPTEADDGNRLQDCIVSVYAAVLNDALAVKVALESGVSSTPGEVRLSTFWLHANRRQPEHYMRSELSQRSLLKL